MLSVNQGCPHGGGGGGGVTPLRPANFSELVSWSRPSKNIDVFFCKNYDAFIKFCNFS